MIGLAKFERISKLIGAVEAIHCPTSLRQHCIDHVMPVDAIHVLYTDEIFVSDPHETLSIVWRAKGRLPMGTEANRSSLL